MPAAIGEGIELLDIAQREPGLLGHPAPQADFERAMRARAEGAEGQAVPSLPRWPAAANDEDLRLLPPDADNGRVEPDLDVGIGARGGERLGGVRGHRST